MMESTLFKNKDECCGCAVCEFACKEKAISMIPDAEGFLFPLIDKEKCIDCGRCVEVCGMKRTSDMASSHETAKIYAVRHSNDETRFQSQSGGLFTAISDPILNEGGIVYGAGFEDDFSVAHIRTATKAQRDALRGSKYVQSNLRKALPLIECDLANGKTVLFSGTPCQCAGVGRVFSKYDGLLLCDLVCHGTPSPMVWRDYLSYKERKHKGKVKKAEFRNTRRFGWRSVTQTLTIGEREYHDRLYTALFLSHKCLRTSCHRCPFANMDRISDITMGDFWKIEKSLPEFEIDNMGISIAIINTEKGSKLFSVASADIVSKQCEHICFERQPLLSAPAEISPKREAFWIDYRNGGFSRIAKKHSLVAQLMKAKDGLRRLLLRFGLLEVAKKMLHAFR